MDGILPAPNAAAWPGSSARQTTSNRIQEPRGSANDDMAGKVDDGQAVVAQSCSDFVVKMRSNAVLFG